MSHSAFISFEINIDTEKRELADIKNNLINVSNLINSHLVKNEINKLLLQVKQIEDELINIGQIKGERVNGNYDNKDTLIQKYNLRKSNLIKIVQNMSINVSYDDIVNERTHLINNLIVSNGFLSKLVLQRLEESRMEFTADNFNLILDQIKQETIDTEKHASLKEELKNYVLSQKIDPKLKGSLLNEFMFINNYQELSDYAPYVKEVINQYNEALNKNKIYTTIFKKYKYTNKSIEFIIQKDNQNKTKPRYLFISKFKNTSLNGNAFTLNLNFDGSVSYEIGDYERHMCWSLAQNVEQDLNEFGYVKNKQIITRAISGARPLSKERKMKVNTKND
ncbi:hypothetical protein EG856_02790 [Mycoplasmopsis phocirhinis]|uniref:Uncharacterized protein n=1 Tax=Mycoplasmopsis phocirhinis TaxID=142650 RepID=A0A4P6MTV8_9BACT|nr:hypothetical protein [Mycoplasmopsis phocirhinis]QBF34827.1 hypothetical protein EG856_02790 [Mycoplasmopsis phocirhinis]